MPEVQASAEQNDFEDRLSENPLRALDDKSLDRLVKKFFNDQFKEHDSVTQEELRIGARLARNYGHRHRPERVPTDESRQSYTPSTKSNMALDSIPQHVWKSIEVQQSKKLWDEPKKLLLTLLICWLASMTQGWDQVTNGNLNWPPDSRKDVFKEQFMFDYSKLGRANAAMWAFATFLVPFFVDPIRYSRFFGRRDSMFIAATLNYGATIACSFSQNQMEYFIARAVLGLGFATKASVAPIWESEVLPPAKRGQVLVSWQVFTAIGTFAGSAATYIFRTNWRYQVLSGCIPGIMLLIVVYLGAESPRLLITRGKYIQAFNTLVGFVNRAERELSRTNRIEKPAFIRLQEHISYWIRLPQLDSIARNCYVAIRKRPKERHGFDAPWTLFWNFLGAAFLALLVPRALVWGRSDLLVVFIGLNCFAALLVFLMLPSTDDAISLEELGKRFRKPLRTPAFKKHSYYFHGREAENESVFANSNSKVFKIAEQSWAKSDTFKVLHSEFQQSMLPSETKTTKKETQPTNLNPRPRNGDLSHRVMFADTNSEKYCPVLSNGEQNNFSMNKCSSACSITANFPETRTNSGDPDFSAVRRLQFEASVNIGHIGYFHLQRFARFLAQHPKMHRLHEVILRQIGKHNFVIEYSRILEIYYRKLTAEAKDEVEKAAVKMFELRWHRSCVAWTIINDLESVEDDQFPDSMMKQGETPGRDALLDFCLPKLLDNNTRQAEHRLSLTTNSELLSIVHALEFLQRGVSFHGLLLDIELLRLRPQLREILETVPRDRIRVFSENDSCLMNKTKRYLEDYTKFKWDWWPLAPLVPDIEPGERRLEYKLCGRGVYHKLSLTEANTMSELLEELPAHPSRCHCCQIKTEQITWRKLIHLFIDCLPDGLQDALTLSFGVGTIGKIILEQTDLPMRMCIAILFAIWGIFVSKALYSFVATSDCASPSKASERYTPMQSSSAHTATCDAALNRSNPFPVTSGNSHIPLQAQQNESCTSSSRCIDLAYRILFAVQGARWSLELEQIGISSVINDPIFFRELNTRYRRHCSWIKLILSPFHFRSCRFVKFEKFDVNRIISKGEDLPDYHGFEHDYEYTPRPGEIPLIDPQTFAICLKACKQPCAWPLLNPWHDCISVPPRHDKIRCIPKKKSEFDISSENQAFAWGIEADHALSFVVLAVYHLIPILAAFGFWIYWLVKHPGDWQNAAVPILTILAFFAVFWVLPFAKHLGMGKAMESVQSVRTMSKG